MRAHFTSLQFPGINLERVAIIEMSFRGGAYDKAVAFYQNLLGFSPAPAPSPYLFQVTETIGLMLISSAGQASTKTTVYWKLMDGDEQTLRDAYQRLIDDHNCRQATPPYPLENANGADTWLGTLQDPGDNVFGIIINPPVPFIGKSTPAELASHFVIEPTHVINPPVTVDGEGGNVPAAGS